MLVGKLLNFVGFHTLRRIPGLSFMELAYSWYLTLYFSFPFIIHPEFNLEILGTKHVIKRNTLVLFMGHISAASAFPPVMRAITGAARILLTTIIIIRHTTAINASLI